MIHTNIFASLITYSSTTLFLLKTNYDTIYFSIALLMLIKG